MVLAPRTAVLSALMAMVILVSASFAQDVPTRDPALDRALEFAAAENWAEASALAQGALQAARTAQEKWFATETLATIAHLSESDAEALVLLTPLLAEGEALFGQKSARLVPVLRMLGATEGNLGHDAEATRAMLRAVQIGRAEVSVARDDQLLTMSDLARQFIDIGDPAAAGMLGAEMVIVGTDEDGAMQPAAQEGQALRALAQLRMGHAVESLALAMPLLELDAELLAPDAADILDVFNGELLKAAASEGDAEAVTGAWRDAAMRTAADRTEAEAAASDALMPMMAALGTGDAPAADAAARAALQSVLADDPVVVNAYFALLAATLTAGRTDLATTWAFRLAEMPTGYLASLELDPIAMLADVADSLLNEGRFGEAVDLSSQIVVLSSLRDGAGSVGVQRSLVRLGAAYRDAGRWSDAEATLNEAITLGGTDTGSDPVQIHRARVAVQGLVDLGLLQLDRGKMDAAEVAFLRARTLLQTTDAGKDAQGWPYVLGQLAQIYAATGRLQQAETVAREAIDRAIAVDGESSRAAQQALFDLGRLQLAAGALDAAANTADRAARAASTLPADDPERSRVTVLQATVLDRMGRTDESHRLFEAMLAPGAGTDAGVGAVVALTEAAAQTARNGNSSAALRFLDQAVAALPAEHPMLAYLWSAQGLISAQQGDLTAAIVRLREATWALTQPDRRTEPFARDQLPLHVNVALSLSDQTEGADRSGYVTEAFQVAQRVNELSAGAALGQATARLRAGTPVAAALARDLEGSTRSLADARAGLLARLGNGGDATAERNALSAARAAFADAGDDLATAFPQYAAFADPRPVDLLSAMRLLRPSEVLVVFATSDIDGLNGDPASVAIAITNAGYVTAHIPSRSDLAALARDLRCQAALTDRSCGVAKGLTRGAFSLDGPTEAGPEFDLAIARQAYLALLAPVSDAFRGKTSLILVPDRTLASLPFHLMLSADPTPETTLRNAPWLIRDMAVTVMPTVSGVAALRDARTRQSRATAPFLGVGDPMIGAQRQRALPYDCAAPPEPGLYAASFVAPAGPILRDAGVADTTALAALPALPDTRCELRREAELFGTPDAILLHETATEGRLKAMSASGELEAFRVLSFATHGLIAGELGGNDAGLVFTPPNVPDGSDDGLLTTTEIAALKLDADFVLLSACNTAAGSTRDTEGLSGLASAFFLAGARSLLVSHWPVYSDAAGRLTTGVFESLRADPGIDRAEALRRSMLGILDDPDASARMLHPAYWAPFMFVGEGGGT